MRSLFRFPNPVNEASARLVAGGVVLQCVAFLVARQWWQLIPLAYGFVARVATGPTMSPLGQFVTRIVTPALARRNVGPEQRDVPGPPKRFAQAIGATLSVGALVAWAAGGPAPAILLVVGITVAAGLESFFGYCLGCRIFGVLMRRGVIPATVCESCNDISGRLAAASHRLAAEPDLRPPPGPRAAKLYAMQFRAAKLQSAEFRAAEVQSAEFRAAGLQAAEFRVAEFRAAESQGAEFRAAESQGAEFRAAESQGAEFRAAESQAAQFEAAASQATEFRAADVQAAASQAAEFEAAQFEATEYQVVEPVGSART